MNDDLRRATSLCFVMPFACSAAASVAAIDPANARNAFLDPGPAQKGPVATRTNPVSIVASA